VEIKMIPAVALGGPKELFRRIEKAIERFARVHILFRLFPKESVLLPGRGVYDPKLFCFVPPFVVVIKQTLAVSEPLKLGSAFLGRKLEPWRPYVDPRSRLNIENDRLRLR